MRKQKREITNDQWEITLLTLSTTSNKFHLAMWLSNYLSYSSLTNHKFYFKCRWNPWETPLGRFFLIKCSHFIWNQNGVFSWRVFVGILTTLVYFLQNTSSGYFCSHRRIQNSVWQLGWRVLQKYLTAKSRWLCLPDNLSWMFGRVLNTPLLQF